MQVLLIEDIPHLSHILKKSLTSYGYAIHHITSKDNLSATLRYFSFDLIILNLKLEDISGIEICEKIRMLGSRLPILAVATRGQLDDKVRVLDKGADICIIYPFLIKELLANVRALLRRPSSYIEEILRTEDLSLCPASRIVNRGSTPVYLRKKEFGILEFLLRNKGRVLTRDEILQHVWSHKTTTSTNTVDVHIRQIRKKIDDSKTKKLISTVHGVGYRLEG